MNIQIIGTKKCKDTQKALRFFSERRVLVSFRDLAVKGLSAGEIRNIAVCVPVDELINKNSPLYEKKNLKYISHNVEDVLLEEPLLLKTPIVRAGKKSVSGLAPDAWADLISGNS